MQQFGDVCLARQHDGRHRRRPHKRRLHRQDHTARRRDFRGQLKLGMTGQPEIVTQRESLLSILIHGIRRSISLG